MEEEAKPHELNLFTLYSLSKQALDNIDFAQEGVRTVVDIMQEMLRKGQSEAINTILKEAHTNLLHADILVAILTITRSHTGELKERPHFFDRAFAQIHEIDNGRTDKYLATLK
jgi:hypothetical protein